MIGSGNARVVANLAIASALVMFLGACSSMSLPSLSSSPPPDAEPGVAPEMPATIRADAAARLATVRALRELIIAIPPSNSLANPWRLPSSNHRQPIVKRLPEQ